MVLEPQSRTGIHVTRLQPHVAGLTMQGFVGSVETMTVDNTDFRQVL